MKKGWKQTWKNLLFQHFEIANTNLLNKYLPKDCTFEYFEGKFYLGLVAMNMTNVRHKAMQNIVWFSNYNELNVRTYIVHNNRPGVLFLSLDVDSIISILGARILYGLPYRYSTYEPSANSAQKVCSLRKGAIEFQTQYSVTSEPKRYKKGSFAFWATERYFFANKYLGVIFKGEIEHQPWELSTATAHNTNLSILERYSVGKRHPEILFCKQLDVQTNSLTRI